MSEAEFEREAAQLFQNLGLQLGKETLDFFTSESVHKSDWKSVLKRPTPSPPRKRRITVGDRPRRQKPGGESSVKENEKPRNGSVIHFKKVLSTPPRSPASSSQSSGSRRHRRASESSRLAGDHSQEKAKPASTEKHPHALHFTTNGMNAGGSGGQAKPKNGILQHSSSRSATEVSPQSKKKPLVSETDSPLQTQAPVPTRVSPHAQTNGFHVAESTSNKRESATRTSPLDNNSSNTQVIYSRKPSLKILSVTTTSSSIVRSVKDRSDDSSVGSPESGGKPLSPESIEKPKRAAPEKQMFPVRTERRASTEKRKSLEVTAKPALPEQAKKRWSQPSVNRRVSPEDDEKPPQLPPKRRPRMRSKPSETSLEVEAPMVLNAPRSSLARNSPTQKQSSVESNASERESRETAVPSSHWIYDQQTSPESFPSRTKSPDPNFKERRPDHSIYRLPSEGSRSTATPSPVERESAPTSATDDLRRYSRGDSVCSIESSNYYNNEHTYAILEPPGFSYFGGRRGSPSPDGGDLRWYDSMDDLDLAVSPEDLRREPPAVTTTKDASSASETESEQNKTALDRSTQFQSPSQMPTVSALATNTIQALSTLMEALTPSTEHLDRIPYLANGAPPLEFESAEDDIDSGSVTISSGPVSPPTSPEVGLPASCMSPEVANHRPVSISPEFAQLRSSDHSTPSTRSTGRSTPSTRSTDRRTPSTRSIDRSPSTGLTIETDFPVTTHAENDEEFFGYCARCKKAVFGVESGLVALDNIYHTECFSCSRCSKSLVGKDFYAFGDEVLCETDHLATLEHCYTCRMRIRDRVLKAFGRSYHPTCFRCSVCGMCLDGVPYTNDDSQKVYCIQDFHMVYAPKCAACNQPIAPQPGKAKSIRVVAMERSFHVECYTCEDCGKQLASIATSSNSEMCYPMHGHLLCKSCHTIRSKCLPRTTSL